MKRIRRSLVLAVLLPAAAGVALQGSQWAGLGGSDAGNGISGHLESSLGASIAFDGGGHPVVAWQASYLGAPPAIYDTHEIYVRRWNGQHWVGLGGSDGHNGISDHYGMSAGARVAVGPDGNPVVAWSEQYDGIVEVFLRRWNGSEWEELGGSASGGGVSRSGAVAWHVDLALEADGTPVVAWDQAQPDGSPEVRLLRWDGRGWNTLDGSHGSLIVSHGLAYASTPSLAIDPDGFPVVAWQKTGAGATDVYLRRWNGQAWVGVGASDVEQGVSKNDSNLSLNPQLGLDGHGRPVVAWVEFGAGGGAVQVRGWNDKSWLGYAGWDGPGGIGQGLSPTLAVDGQGHVIVAWAQWTPGFQFQAWLKRWDGTAWSGLAGSAEGGGISGSPFHALHPAMALDGHGRPAVAWTEQLTAQQLPWGPTVIRVRALQEGGSVDPQPGDIGLSPE